VLKVLDIEHQPLLATTEVNVYETSIGLQKAVPEGNGRREFEAMVSRLIVLPLDRKASLKAAEIASFLLRTGKMIDHLDCLTAGILLTNGYDILLTRNISHFSRIPGLKVETY